MGGGEGANAKPNGACNVDLVLMMIELNVALPCLESCTERNYSMCTLNADP